MDFREITEFFRDTFKYIITAVIVLVILVYIASFQQVIGPSMMPNLENRDILLISKLHPRFFSIRRNDIVAIFQGERHMIKRVIGLPGEHIEFISNYLYINGRSFQENYINTSTENFSLQDLGYEIIPEGMFLVLGDNRENSLDSRDFGLIREDDIVGRGILRIWPINRLRIIR